MRILLVGGIYGKSAVYRDAIGPTPETVLEAGLRRRGHDIILRGHHEPLDAARADVVHVHHLSYGALAAVDGARPYVFTAHCFGDMTKVRGVALRFVVARAHASVVLSEPERRWQLAQAPGGTPRPVIPNGVDPCVFGYRPPPPLGRTLQLLYVGQLIPLKGLDYLLRALAVAAREGAVRLRLVYQVDDEERRLRALAAELGLKVEFLGSRRSEELADLYAESHALVLPSTAEALPSVVTEAIFVGRPVVASDVGAIADQVGDFGRVIPARSVPALAAALRELRGGYDAFAARSSRASAAAVARYSIDAMVDAHEALYRSLLETWSGRRRTPDRIAAGILARTAARARGA